MLLYIFVGVILFIYFSSRYLRNLRHQSVVGFFHPYCNAGGGGERVLWCAIRDMQEQWPQLKYVVYSGDGDSTKEQILLKAKQRFGIEVDPANVEFVFLRFRRICEADLYPRFTLLLQTLAGGVLGCEALWRLNPEIFIDTMGVPLTLPLFRYIGGSKVIAYIHYPTISTDMIALVDRREESYNNSGTIAQSNILSHCKMVYYRLFAFVYGLAGSSSNTIMVNGSWTKSHVSKLFHGVNPKVVFPPCDVSAFLAVEQIAEDLFERDNVLRIASVGQIRPEKNHKLQLEILRNLKKEFEDKDVKVKLTIAGGCRNEEDEKRVRELKAYAKQLGVDDCLEWQLNVDYDKLLELLGESLISLHTMWNEHFGISVVEGMAAGCVMLAHDSGGPQMDIVVPLKGQCVGYLSASDEEFTRSVLNIVGHTRAERDAIRSAARKSVARFSEEEFKRQWIKTMQAFCR